MLADSRGRLRVAFMYLGRAGVLRHLLAQLAQSARQTDGLDVSFVISRMNAGADGSSAIDPSTLALRTFEAGSPMATARNFFAARRAILAHLAARRPHAIVNLMQHVWTPLLIPAIAKAGIPYVSVVHDAIGHPGDSTGILLPWLHREARSADRVITLSRHVTAQLRDCGIVPAGRIAQLFLPDLAYYPHTIVRERNPDKPLRLLFFGRILEYKGLPLLLDAIETLRAEGIEIRLGVAGVGDIRRVKARLEHLGAEIINRWIDDRELSALLARYEAMVLPYVECSQSAVAAAAFGSGMPAIGMPVGGIAEQISDGVTGVLARDATARSLAHAIRRLATDAALYRRICSNLRATSRARSTDLFLAKLLQEVVGLQSNPVRVAVAFDKGAPVVERLPEYSSAV